MLTYLKYFVSQNVQLEHGEKTVQTYVVIV